MKRTRDDGCEGEGQRPSPAALKVPQAPLPAIIVRAKVSGAKRCSAVRWSTSRHLCARDGANCLGARLRALAISGRAKLAVQLPAAVRWRELAPLRAEKWRERVVLEKADSGRCLWGAASCGTTRA